MSLPDSDKPIPPPPAPKPRRPRMAKDSPAANAWREKQDRLLQPITDAVLALGEVQIPAETDPASAFRADMQLRKAIAERRLAALEAKRAAVDGDRRDKKALIDAEAAAKKERLDVTADTELAQIDDESASVIRELAGIGAALDASQPPAIPEGAAHTGVGGYIGLTRPAPADDDRYSRAAADRMLKEQDERLKGTYQ